MSDEITKKALLNVEIKSSETVNKISELKTQVDDLKNKMKALDTATEEGRQQYVVYEQQIKALNTASREYQKEIQNQVKAQNAEKESINELKANIANLTAEYEAMSKEQRKSAAGKELQKSISEQNEALKSAKLGTKGFSESLANLPGASGGAVKGLLDVGKAMWALVANPIGAVIAGIVAAFMLLKKGLDTNREGTERLNQILAPFKTLMQSILTIIGNVANTLLKGAQAVTDFTMNLLSFIPAINKLNEANKESISIEKELQRIRRADIVDAAQDAVVERQIAELKKKMRMKDVYDEQQRLEFARQIDKLALSDAADDRKRAEDELQNFLRQKRLEGKSSQTQFTNDEAKQFSDLVVKKENAMTSYYEKTSRSASMAATLSEELEADKARAAENSAKKATEAAEKKQQAIKKAQDEEINSETNILNSKIKAQGKIEEFRLSDENYYNSRKQFLEQNAADEMAIVEKSLNFKKISAEEAAQKLIEIENTKNDKIKDLDSKRLDVIIKDLEYQTELSNSKLEEQLAGKKRTDEELHLSELQRIQRDVDAQIKAEELKLQNDKSYQAEHDKQVELIRQKGRTATAIEDAAFEQKQKELNDSRIRTNLSNELEIYSDNLDKKHAIKLQQLELDRKAEIEEAEKTGADVSVINKKYAKLERDLADETRKEKIDKLKGYAEQVADGLSALNDLINTLGEREVQDAETKNNAKKSDLDKQLKAGLISQQEHDYQVAMSEYELDKKRDKINRDAAIRAKELAVINTIINVAAGIASQLAAGPAGIPLAIAAGALGAVQLATIIATPLPAPTAGAMPKYEDFAPKDTGSTASTSTKTDTSAANAQKELEKAATDAQKAADKAADEYEKAKQKAEEAIQNAKDLAAKQAQEAQDRADKAVQDAWEKSDKAIAEASKRADDISNQAQKALSDAMSNLEKAQNAVLSIQEKIDKKAADKLAQAEAERIKALEDAEKLIFDAQKQADSAAEKAQSEADKAKEKANEKELAYLELLQQSQDSGKSAEQLQREAVAAKANYENQINILWYQPEAKAALKKQMEDAQKAAEKAKDDADKKAEKLEQARIDAENARIAAEQAQKIADDAKIAQNSAAEAAKQATLAAEERARQAAEAAKAASDAEDAAWQRELESAKQAEIIAQQQVEAAKVAAEQAKIDAEIAAQKKLDAELAAEARKAAYDEAQAEKKRLADEAAQAKADQTAREAQQAADDAAKAAALAAQAAAQAAAAAGWATADTIVQTNDSIVQTSDNLNSITPIYTFRNDGGYTDRNIVNNKSDVATKQDLIDAIKSIKIYTAIEDIRKEDKIYTEIEQRANY